MIQLRRHWRRWLPVSLLSVCLAWPTYSVAEIYSYTDSRGKKVFVDSPSKIPAKYRKDSRQRAFAGQSHIRSSETASVLESADIISERFKLEADLRRLTKTLQRMETAVTIRGNQVLVPVGLNWRGQKKTLNLLLDTGASITVLHENAVSSLNPSSREQSYARVAGGGRIKTERVVFDQLSVGPYDIANKNTAVIEHQGGAGFDGLLGMDVLGNLNYNIDFQNRKIVWSPERYDELLTAQTALQERIAALSSGQASGENSPQ